MRILDSDVCVEILRGNSVVSASRERVPGPVATTWISAAELYYGASRSRDPEKNRERVDQLLASLDVLGLDAASARLFGDLKTTLERQGRRVEDADLLIAAITLAHGAILATGNRRHYERISGLVLEDWIRPPAP